MKNAVIYARYSSDSQSEASIEGQLRDCHRYAKEHNITVIDEYIDRAMTGRNDDRPNFQQMIKDSYQKRFEIILIWRFDRFSRNLYDYSTNQKILTDNGVKLVSICEEITDDPIGTFLETLLVGQAVYYSQELSLKVKRGLDLNASKGKMNGGTVTFGYRLTKEQTYEINEEQAEIVREVFTRYSEGEKTSVISKDLTQRGVRTRYGNGISVSSINHMLKNRRYLGEYRYNEIFHENGIPRIISNELFERAQRRMEQSKKAPALHKSDVNYILTTKLFCGRCSTSMAGESGTGRRRTHYYYKCGNAKRKKGCTKKAVRKEWIEDLVISHTLHFIMDDKLVNSIANYVLQLLGEENKRIPQLKNRLRSIVQGIDNLLDAIQNGLLTDAMRTRLEKLEIDKKEVEKQIEEEELQRPIITKKQILAFIKKFRDTDPNDLNACKKMIDVFINRIYLYDDKILITYNYNSENHTITLDDANDAIDSNLGGPSAPGKRHPFIAMSLS